MFIYFIFFPPLVCVLVHCRVLFSFHIGSFRDVTLVWHLHTANACCCCCCCHCCWYCCSLECGTKVCKLLWYMNAIRSLESIHLNMGRFYVYHVSLQPHSSIVLVDADAANQPKPMKSHVLWLSFSVSLSVYACVCARELWNTSAVVIHNHIKYTFIHILCRQCACTLLLITTSPSMLSQQLKHNSNSNENVLVLVIMNECFVRTHQQSTLTKHREKSVTSKTLQMPKNKPGHEKTERAREREMEKEERKNDLYVHIYCLIFHVSENFVFSSSWCVCGALWRGT